jgi:hypothetical protein
VAVTPDRSDAATKRVRKLLQWLCDHNQEDRRVTIGCKTCRETCDLLAATALTAWLNPFHDGHEVWMRSPFGRKKS